MYAISALTWVTQLPKAMRDLSEAPPNSVELERSRRYLA